MVEDDNVLTKKPIGMKLSNRDILQVLIIIVIMVMIIRTVKVTLNQFEN